MLEVRVEEDRSEGVQSVELVLPDGVLDMKSKDPYRCPTCRCTLFEVDAGSMICADCGEEQNPHLRG